MSNKFISVVIDDSGWPWVAAQPLAVEEYSDAVAGLVSDGNKFGPAGGFIDDCQGLGMAVEL